MSRTSSDDLVFHNAWHLGDCLYHLHYLRKLGAPAVFHCNPEYHAELSLWITDRPEIRLAPIDQKPEHSVDCWIGADEYVSKHPNWHAYDKFYVDWFKHLSGKIGVKCPIHDTTDMLFDNPLILERPNIPGADFLVINAPPKSHQWDYSAWEFQKLIGLIVASRKTVIATHPCGVPGVTITTKHNWSILDIANCSTKVGVIIAIDTGPTGSTFNIWNQTRVRARFILHKTNYFSHARCVPVTEMSQIVPVLQKYHLL